MMVKADVPPAAAALALTTLPHHPDINGDLVVVEGQTHVPFPIARIFYVLAPEGASRGQHAHRACTQFLTCPRGEIDVICDDGSATARFTLDRPNLGLLVPPGIWSEQIYRTPGSALLVICDRPYEADDYIRDYSAFKAYRAGYRR